MFLIIAVVASAALGGLSLILLPNRIMTVDHSNTSPLPEDEPVGSKHRR
ncbi:hypothetical protein ACFXHA_08700 [Nocardia sp. NPDC059240]